MNEDLYALLLADDARGIKRRFDLVMKDTREGEPGPVRIKIETERRAKKACPSCENLVDPETGPRHRGELFCGKETCRDRLDRWRAFRRSG